MRLKSVEQQGRTITCCPEGMLANNMLCLANNRSDGGSTDLGSFSNNSISLCDATVSVRVLNDKDLAEERDRHSELG